MQKAAPALLAGILLLSIVTWMPAADAQTHSHKGHDGMQYVIVASGDAINIKNRVNVDSSMVVHMETTRANDNAVSFRTVEGELTIGEDTYSIVGGKASLAVKSGRLGTTMMLEDSRGKIQLLRVTTILADPLPHGEDEQAEISFKVAKALRFWKLDMKGEIVLSVA